MKILVGVLAVLLVLAGVGFVLPTDFAVAKSVTIDAEPAQVHAWVGDLQKWPEWGPWHEDDPTMVTTLGDKTVGVGANQSWTGKDGDGELTLTESDPATGIAYDMAFIMDGERYPSSAVMSYEKVDGGTQVTWSMEGDVGGMMPPVIAGYMNTFMMKGSIGDMFERGLAALKGKVEGG